jgi:hypothetical protein
MQAPSSSLSSYIQSGRLQSERGAISGGRVAFELQDNYVILQNCAREAVDLSERLAQEAHAWSESSVTTPRDPISYRMMSEVSQRSESGAVAGFSGAVETLLSPLTTDATISPADNQSPSDLELALMMTSMAEAVKAETKMMVSPHVWVK